jgi:hypothetical protein
MLKVTNFVEAIQQKNRSQDQHFHVQSGLFSRFPQSAKTLGRLAA